MEKQKVEYLAYYRTEEPYNIFFTRPLASVIVDAVAAIRWITPNVVTVAGSLIGVLAAVFIAAGSPNALVLGALMLQLSLVLDMVDGQLARRTGSGSELGRQLDGAGDYVVGIALFIATLIALLSGIEEVAPATGVVLLVCASFASIALHSLSYDFIKNKFASIARDGRDAMEDERRSVESDSGDHGSGPAKRLVLRIYAGYTLLQHSLFPMPRYRRLDYDGADGVEAINRERVVLRLWSWLGPNTHFLVIIVAALFGNLFAGMLVIAVPMNIYFMLLMLATRRRMGIRRAGEVSGESS